MSFAGVVREEISQISRSARHCQIAELTAVLSLCGGVAISAKDTVMLRVQTENLFAAKKTYFLIRRLFDYPCEVRVRRRSSSVYTLAVRDEKTVRDILQTCMLLRGDDEMSAGDDIPLTDPSVIEKDCCKRAFLRGAFLVSGSLSDPHKSYHMEIVVPSMHGAGQLREMAEAFGIYPRVITRKGSYLVYLKDAEQISDMLSVMEAHKSRMEMENIRILRQIGGTVNRQVNCETANLGKTVSAAVAQIRDIEYIRDKTGLDHLPPGLQEIAQVRLRYPDMPLKDLGLQLDEPIGKSGVNHRLKKISRIAESLRERSGT